MVVIREALVDRRLGYRQQLPHQGVEYLKLLRRAAHYASIFTLFLLLACAAAAQSQPPTPTARERKNPPSEKQTQSEQVKPDDVRGTPSTPAVVRLLPIRKTPEEAAQDQANRGREATTNRRVVWLTATLAALTLGLLIVAIFQYQTYRETLATNRIIERACLSAGLGDAIYQDERLRFEAVALLKNSGHTAASRVTFRAAAKIMALPVPADFDYPLPDSTAGKSVSFMPPGADKIISVLVPERLADADALQVKRGDGRALVMWGRVDYRDVFNDERFLKFAFIFHWVERADKDNKPLPPKLMTADTPSHNEAN